MAAPKRKERPVVGSEHGNRLKKAKVEAANSGKSKSPQANLEAETDSDPIMESDTTEHSGEDDGVSWPSEEEGQEGGAPIGAEGRFGGGVKLPVSQDKATGTAPSNQNNGTNSRESHAKQKALVQERKAAKPHADPIARSKKIWERLRRQSHVPLAERKELIAELFDIITGKVKDFTLKHDAGRVIQTALKYGNLDQKKMIAQELKGQFRQLAESRYAKFTIGKLLSNADDDIRDLIVPEFYGHVRRLIKHPEAGWILDDIYRGAASKRQKAILLKEWYGAEFSIFKAGDQTEQDSDLKTLLAKHPEKRAPIMRYLFDMINQLIQKKTTGFTMLHDAMLQYYLNVTHGKEDANEFLELLKGDEEGDLMKNLAFTKSGARLVALALAQSSAKDRKHLLKVYKGVMQTLAFDNYGHQVLLAAFDVIDDTVLTSKSIYSELLPRAPSTDSTASANDLLLDYSANLNARIPLLYPLTSRPKSILSDEDIHLLVEINTIRTSTSKKDPVLRHRELARSISPQLLSFIAAKASTLIQNSFGCLFMQEALVGADVPDASERLPALDAIVALFDDNDKNKADGLREDHLTSPAAGRMLKTLVHSGQFDAKSKAVELCTPPLGFADMLFAQIAKGGDDELVKWATGSNSFVVVGLLESADFGKKEELKGMLSNPPVKERLMNAASAAVTAGKDGEEQSGGGKEDKAPSEKKARRGKKSEHGGNSNAGGAGPNRGTQLLLRMLGN